MKGMEFAIHKSEATNPGTKVGSSELAGMTILSVPSPRSVGSNEIDRIFERECKSGRSTWGRLTIAIDEVELSFWHPAELQLYCDVFAMRPFPTARTLAMRDPDETRLNRHWLSRLPKKAKEPRFRERFLTYVASEPLELKAFRQFYGL